MGGRGTFAAGNSVPYSFEAVGRIGRAKILKGIQNVHGLPEEAHSSYAYASLNHDGTLRTLRFYDTGRNLRYEIAYHRESKLEPSGKPVLHYHVYNPTKHGREWRGSAIKATKAMRKRYGKLFGKVWQ